MTDWLVTGAGGALGSVLMRMLSEQRAKAEGLISLHGARAGAGS
jgi:FlaA1/EpsC-like NDP-sugar epimerase